LDPRVEALRLEIRDVPDFPKKGILFKDITTLLKSPVAFRSAMDLLTEMASPWKPTRIVAVESRGFILGAVLAERLDAGFVPVRKRGKLPSAVRQVTYSLEYGTDVLEMHEDAVGPEDRVLIVDDVLATGGTAEAVGKLVAGFGAHLEGFLFLVELDFLKGRERLQGADVRSLIRY
jgi:adenine phosphoribosyltransferase